MATRMLCAALVLAAAGLTACGGGPEITLKNPQNGQSVSCRSGLAMNPGLAPDPSEDGVLQNCVDNYTRQGYQIASARQK